MKAIFQLLWFFWPFFLLSFSENEYKSFLEDQCREFLKKNNSAGLAVAVYKEAFDLEKPYEKVFCFGQARRSRKINVSESTLFRLGGLGKLFTLFLLMHSEKQGLCKLEDKVDSYFPKTFTFPSYQSEKPSLRQLALELASLPNLPTIPLKVTQATEMEIRTFFKNFKLPRAPGKKYEPSELGYSCLGYLLGRIGKTSCCERIQQEVLKPLGMKETVSSIPFSKAYKLAYGHRGIGEVSEQQYHKDGSFFKSILGWSSTIEDMQLVLKSMLKKNNTQFDAIVTTLYKPQYTFPENPANKLSLGFKITPLSSKHQVPLYFQHVSYQGYDHFIGLVPEIRGGVVILSNSEYGTLELGKKLLEAFFEYIKIQPEHP